MTARAIADWDTIFRHRVRLESGCWIWCGYTSKHGYGVVCFHNQRWLAHRLSWALSHGPIPKDESSHGICVCHKCDVRNCVNPTHLFLGSHRDNIQDMEKKGRARHPAGEQHKNAKLSKAQADAIRAMYIPHITRQVDIAKKFGVSQRVISLILRGESYI